MVFNVTCNNISVTSWHVQICAQMENIICSELYYKNTLNEMKFNSIKKLCNENIVL